MGIKERRKKEKEQLKELILKEATLMFLEEGYEKTSMRKIAQKIEYSVGTLYLYYENKNELFYGVQSVAFEKFLNYMEPLQEIESPVERIKRLGETYIAFALDNKAYYDIMFMIEAPMESVEETEGWKRGQRTFSLIEEAVSESQGLGYFEGKNPRAVALVFWSAMHGMVALMLRDRLDKMKNKFGDDIESIIHQASAILLEKMLKN